MSQAITIGIAGGTGSGKTTLARTLKESFEEDVVLLCMDWYYRSYHHLSFDARKKLNFDHPDAFDTAFFIEQMKQLKDMKPIQRHADIIVPEGGMNEVATDMIVEKIKSVLRA